MTKSIAGNIRMFRERKGLTQFELAERAGVTQAQISYCEKGSRVPSLKLCKKIAAVLDCSLSEIVDTDNERRAV